MTTTTRALLPLATALLLTSCGGNDTATRTSASPDATPTAASTDALRGAGCGWQAASDADTANIAFPDKAARYWVALVPATPGTRLRLNGVYPDARYLSFNAYDAALRPTDAIADRDLAPDAGSRNPFSEAGVKPGGRYTAFLAFGPAPETRAANTFYTGQVGAGPLQLPNGGLVTIIYRTYVARGERQDGNVPLPLLTLESADGQSLGTLPTCSEPLLPNLGGLAPRSGLNAAINEADYPDQLAAPFPTAVYPPVTRVFYGLPDTAANIAGDQTGLSGQLPAPPATGGGGFLSNIHNDYTTSAFARRYGNLFLMRAKAPGFRSQPGRAFGNEPLRYWSLCQNEFVTQRYTDCSLDADTPVDADGFFTVAISDPADRPQRATAGDGVTWLPWGAYPDGVLLYRQMLADDSYAQAIKRVPKGTPLPEVMGEFAPQVTYCRPEVFDRADLKTAAARFKACQDDQQANPVSTP